MAKAVYSFCHVFLSFRGPDARNTIACLLYNALNDAGYKVFMDDESIRSGEEIDSRIREGIKCSMSAIIIFSENYAYSKWCLDELLLILERKRTSNYVLLPIYYGEVKSADIKYQRGSYGDALEKHKKRHGDKVESWKAALQEVGGCKAMRVAGKLDMFLKKIVEEIGIELCGIVSTLKPFPLVNPRLGGIAQGDDMPYSLSLHPNLGTHFDSNHGQITIFYVSPEQQQPQYMPAATHNDNKVKVKVKEEPAQVPVEEAPSWIKPSDPLVGYPKKLDMFLKVVNEIGNEFSGIASMMNPLPLVNPKLGGAFQVAAMSYLLNLYPNLRDMVSHFNLNHGQLPFNPLNLPQQQPRCMPAATHDNNNTKELDIKEEATESLQIKVEEEPVQEEPSDPLVGYPIKNPPGGEEKVVLYTSLAAVKRVVWDCLKVKMILEGYQLDIEEREETEDPKFRDELHNLVGGLRYPRLFVIGREIGGVTEVEMLHKNGQLSGILQYYKQQLENARRVSSLLEKCVFCEGNCAFVA